jgi:GT2 family glycosyltransferase
MILSVIIPTKERAEVFKLTIESLITALVDIDAEIIVVNDSKSEWIELPSSQCPLQLAENPKSGVASARNLGASLAKGDLLLFLDDDVLVDSKNINVILELHNRYDHAAINLLWIYPPRLLKEIGRKSFGRFLIKYGFTSMREGLEKEWRETDIIETNVAASFCLSMKRTTFLLSGGYNEQFPHAGFEDYDFSMKLKKKGIRRMVYTQSIVYHNEFDRVDLKKWLSREQKGAETRAFGFVLGRDELELETSPVKQIGYSLLSRSKFLLHFGTRLIPDSPNLDWIKHRLIHLLLGTAIFQGYKRGLKDARNSSK